MLNRTRERMQASLLLNKMTEEEKDKFIARGAQYRDLEKSPAWRHIEAFMDGQKRGAHLFMEKEVTHVRAFSIGWLFGTYIKYLAHLFEVRAYNKLKIHLRVTIDQAKVYEDQRRQRDAAKG